MAVYLLHFYDPKTGEHAKLGRSGHYLGCAVPDERLDKRIAEHRQMGKRAGKLVRAMLLNGYDFSVARVWPGEGQRFERWVKRRKRHPAFCPLCMGGTKEVPAMPEARW